MRTKLLMGAAVAALILPTGAFAQSTGSIDFEQDVVVTGARTRGIGGVEMPNTAKAKVVLNKEFISRQTAGQSVDEIINNLPGVSFQNNDPFGSAGGTLSIRGFDGSRISQTFDGVPLNDSGNYAIYSNQQLDPELIEQVNVNLGSTDVDSPTASASGSTVNYTTLTPTDEFGARMLGSAGDYSFFRIFGMVNTGVFTPWGTKAWFAASNAENNVVFNDFGKIKKQQYNAKIYQPIGNDGDFVSIAGNYNQNRNNFFGSAPLRTDLTISPTSTVLRTPGTGTTNRFPLNRDELPYHVERCQTATARPGVADSPLNVVAAGASNNGTACGASFDERYNPSNNGNIRINSRFTLAPGLVMTVEPSFQYVKANGGGTVTGLESAGTLTGTRPAGSVLTPYYGVLNTGPNTGNFSPAGFGYYTGVDLNGDGDKLDTVTLLAPSQTGTRRWGVISSLRYEFSDTQTVRVGYTYDRARHRQTGELTYLQQNGVPVDVFPVNAGIVAANGAVLQKRDRLSFATLHEGYGQYNGKFFDDTISIELGVTAKFFTRNLNNYCFTVASNGNVSCTAQVGAYAAANPYGYNATTGVVTGFAAPQTRNFKYTKVLPSGGLTYKPIDTVTVFMNYSKGVSVPGTDNLYQGFYFPTTTSQANPQPETTDNFDAGLRYDSDVVNISVGPWYTKFTNRLAGAYDVDTQQTVYRNLGRVDKYGIDGSFTYHPIPQVLVYVYGSYLKSKIKNDVLLGRCTATVSANCSALNQPIYALTAGKRESGAPTYTFGGRLQASLGPVDLGVQAKRTGKRFVDDQNLPIIQCTVALVNMICPASGIGYQVYGAAAPAYTTVDFDARVSMEWAGLNKTTYFQFNLQNAFNKFYVGGFTGGQTLVTTVPFAQIGSPRAFIGSLNVQF